MTNFYLQPPSLPPPSKNNNKNKTPVRDGNLMLSKRRTFPPKTITSQKYSIYSKVQHAWQLPLIGYLRSRMQSKSQSTRVSTCLEIASWLCTDHCPTHSLTHTIPSLNTGRKWMVSLVAWWKKVKFCNFLPGKLNVGTSNAGGMHLSKGLLSVLFSILVSCKKKKIVNNQGLKY